MNKNKSVVDHQPKTRFAAYTPWAAANELRFGPSRDLPNQRCKLAPEKKNWSCYVPGDIYTPVSNNYLGLTGKGCIPRAFGRISES